MYTVHYVWSDKGHVYNCRIICVELLYTKYLLIILKILYAVITTLMHCFDTFKSSEAHGWVPLGGGLK